MKGNRVIGVWLAAMVASGAASSAAEEGKPPGPSAIPYLDEHQVPAAPGDRVDSVLGKAGAVYGDQLSRGANRPGAAAVVPAPTWPEQRPVDIPGAGAARNLARDALYRSLQDSVNGMPLIRRTRDALLNLTTVEVRTAKGHADLRRPSADAPAPAGGGDDSVFTTRLLLAEGADLGMAWETNWSPFASRLSYSPLSGAVKLDLQAEFIHGSGLGMTLLHDSNGESLAATLRLGAF